MTREQKLAMHLEAIIWQDSPDGTAMNAAEVELRMAAATPQQRARAAARALVSAPMLLGRERE